MRTLTMLKTYHTRLQRGHRWAWRNEFEPAQLAEVTPGEVVRLVSSDGGFLGVGFANPRSHIVFRLLDTQDRPVDEDLIRDKLDIALEWRRRVRPAQPVCRLVYGESDGLPGLIVDRYGPVIVLVQTVAGMERWTDFIAAELDRQLHPELIILKNTHLLRTLEGLPLEKRLLKGTWSGPVEVDYDQFRVVVDCFDGRKTGLFLDHRENRRMLWSLLRGGETVLDLFSHCGLWSLGALAAGAGAVTCVDNDPVAVECGRSSAALNGWQHKMEFAIAEVVAFLESCRRDFDVVVLDPPALAKKKRYLRDALPLYERLNTLALQRVKRGGILVTSSCSSFVDPGLFSRVVHSAALAAARQLQLVYTGAQAFDHPILLAMPETQYLKCLFFRVIK